VHFCDASYYLLFFLTFYIYYHTIVYSMKIKNIYIACIKHIILLKMFLMLFNYINVYIFLKKAYPYTCTIEMYIPLRCHYNYISHAYNIVSYMCTITITYHMRATLYRTCAQLQLHITCVQHCIVHVHNYNYKSITIFKSYNLYNTIRRR